MVKIATVCSGIGSPEVAIRKHEHEIVFACEYDKYARLSYEALHGKTTMYNDLTKEEWNLPEQYSDLFIGGIPCQAFSLAGKRLGELDPRGLLFFDFYRYVKNQHPKVFIIENVKGLLSDAGGKTFSNWLLLLGNSVNGHSQMFNHPDSLGYNLHHTVLNSKNFGVPQNRERVFIIGIRQDLPNDFRFPKGGKLDKRLKDVLESEVDEKYYLSDKMVESIMTPATEKWQSGKMQINRDIATTINARVHKMGRADTDNYISYEVKNPNTIQVEGRLNSSQDGQVFNINGISQCLSSGHGNMPKILVKEATKQGYSIAEPGDSINLSNPNSETRRGRVGSQIANTLDTACNQAVVEPYCVAMRGRNPNNPSDRTTGSPTEQRLEPNSQGITNTITSVQKDNLVVEPFLNLVHTLSGGKWDKSNESNRRVYDENGLAPTVTTMQGGNQEPKTITNSRIRRLTPLECWRLQGFGDEDFYKAKAVNSDTQLYKQAGNSITTNVMEAIIDNLIHLL